MHINQSKRFTHHANARRVSMLAHSVRLILGAAFCALAALTSSAIAATPRALTDAEVLGIYIQVNGFDVETALLGSAQANATIVRKFATQVSTDHQSVRLTAFDIAAQCKVTPVLPPNRDAAAIEHGKALTTLTMLHGAAFDQAYVQHEIAFHRAAIDAVQKVLEPASTCAALKAHFKSVLPAFQHHLSETEALAGRLVMR